MISAKPSQNATLSAKPNASFASAENDPGHSLRSVNSLPYEQRREIYLRLVPEELRARFNLPENFLDASGRDLLHLNCSDGASTTEMALYHQLGFPDPVLYGHISDTITGHIHVLLYILNDPTSPRFDVDRMPDGHPTCFGTRCRNLEAEEQALEFGLAPGQVRRGLRLLSPAIAAFENFVASLGHDLYFAEPLYYHNAILFERYGFNYQIGRRLMARIHEGFAPGGDLLELLDGSTPFRSPQAAHSIRLRSWAIHDGLLGEPFTGVTMYKHIDRHAGIDSCPGLDW